jgi:hypothetical protein
MLWGLNRRRWMLLKEGGEDLIDIHAVCAGQGII